MNECEGKPSPEVWPSRFSSWSPSVCYVAWQRWRWRHKGNTRAHLLPVSRVTQGRATAYGPVTGSKRSACCLHFGNWALKNPEAWTPESSLYPRMETISNSHPSGLCGSTLLVLPSLEESESPQAYLLDEDEDRGKGTSPRQTHMPPLPQGADFLRWPLGAQAPQGTTRQGAVLFLGDVVLHSFPNHSVVVAMVRKLR